MKRFRVFLHFHVHVKSLPSSNQSKRDGRKGVEKGLRLRESLLFHPLFSFLTFSEAKDAKKKGSCCHYPFSAPTLLSHPLSHSHSLVNFLLSPDLFLLTVLSRGKFITCFPSMLSLSLSSLSFHLLSILEMILSRESKAPFEA